MTTAKEHLILVRCSDGRIQVPHEFQHHYVVHPISLPGGPIAPELFSVIKNIETEKTLEVLLLSIDAMVSMKSPTRIVITAHSHCTAAETVKYDEAELEQAALQFSLMVQKRYPDIRVTVFFDHHSVCGQHRPHPPRFIESKAHARALLVA